MKRKIKIISSIVVILLAVITLVIGNYFYGESVKRGSEVELHSGKPSDVQENATLTEAKKWFADQDVEQISMDSYDDLTLNAGLLKNKEVSKKAVILVHGFRKQGSDMGNYTKFYHEHGFHILMPDLRGHGESEGDYYG